MARQIARVDGNLTTAATWGVVDATSALDSEAANTVLTTAYVETATFTPGAITIDGIAVKVATRPGSTGTITIRLAQGGADVAGTVVTINVSDIESRDGEQGWYFFKFAAPVLLLAATLYTVSAKTSTAAQVNLYRDGTAGNWSRLLRTTTTGAPAAGDSMYILGEWTAAATFTARTVTMDSTAATDYGDGTAANPPGFCIGKNGTLTWGTTAATAYILQLSTRLAIYRAGVMNMGTTATPAPRGGSMTLQFDCAADGDFGLLVYGTLNCQGLSRTAGKIVEQCLMSVDAAVAATTINVNTDTGWLSTDEVAIAPTSRTNGQHETRILNANAGAASFVTTVGLTNAHSGTSPTQAEVILLTRNVTIRAVTSTLMAYITVNAAAIIDADWTSFRYLGAATTGKRGVEMDTTAAGGGSVAFSYCSIRDFEVGGLWMNNADADSFIFEHCVGYNCAQDNAGIGVFINSQNQLATSWRVSDCTLIACGTFNGFGFSTRNLAGTVTNLRVSASSSAGIKIAPINTIYGRAKPTNPWSGLDVHTCGVSGITLDNVDEIYATLVNVWRCATSGISLISNVFVTLTTGNIFGNGLGVDLNGGASGYKWFRGRSLVISGDTSFAQASGIALVPSALTPCDIELDNCTLGVVSGIKTAHTQDIDIGIGLKQAWITLRNTNLASATPIASQANLRPPSFIRYERVNQVTGVHKTIWPIRGTVALDTAVFRTLAPSQSLTPLSAFLKLETFAKRVKVASAGTIAVSVYVRKSAAYNGNAPRLMQRENAAIGVLTDTVLATFAGAADTWVQLSAVTAAATEAGVGEFYVDCDGTAGVVYADDWSGV